MKKYIILFVFITTRLIAQGIYISPFQVNNKWGYQDNSKNVVIEPVYDEAMDFYRDYARVKLNGKYGFINKEGKVVVPIIYEDAAKNLSGTFVPVMQNGKWGYVDAKGKMKVGFIYDEAYSYSSKNSTSAPVRLGDKWGVLNGVGKLFIPCIYDQTGYLDDGLIPIKKNSLWGFINEKGDAIIPLKYTETEGFDHGLAKVWIDSLCGMINIKGEVVIPLQFEYTEYLHGYNIVVTTSDNYEKLGFWTDSGKKITEQEYTGIQDDWNNIITTRKGSSLGLIHKSGKVLLEPEYSEIILTETTPICYLLTKESLSGLFDVESQKIVVPIKYASINQGEGDYFILTNNQKNGIYDCKLRKVLIEPIFDAIEPAGFGNYYQISLNGKMGIIDPTGKVIIEPIYSYVFLKKNKTIVAVSEQEETFTFNLKGEKIK